MGHIPRAELTLALARQRTRLVRLLLYRYLQLDIAIITGAPMTSPRNTTEQLPQARQDAADRANAAAGSHDHDAHDRLIQRVLHAFGPASDGGQVAANIALAQRLVAALIELRLVNLARSTEQDQPTVSKTGQRQRPDQGS